MKTKNVNMQNLMSPKLSGFAYIVLYCKTFIVCCPRISVFLKYTKILTFYSYKFHINSQSF